MTRTAQTLGYAFADSPEGRIIVVASPRGIAYLGWDDTDVRLLAQAVERFPEADLELGANKAEKLAERVTKVADNPKRAKADTIPLDLEGTEFQVQVWEALRTIPAGHTMSYGEVAKAVGRPGAARAVGSACGANPVPIIVPCHRVIAGDGTLGGFGGKLSRKESMLKREGAF